MKIKSITFCTDRTNIIIIQVLAKKKIIIIQVNQVYEFRDPFFNYFTYI
jgi:hypothetical protein